MKSSETDIVIVPGLGGSGPDHWQSRWQAKLANARRIAIGDWDDPDPAIWTRAVVAAVGACDRPAVLVAHSFGAIAAALAAPSLAGSGLRGAFLVAPPSASRFEAAGLGAPLGWWPDATLPVPALVAASRDDEWSSYRESEAQAAAWGATLVDAGVSGHLNTASGHGPWPEGLMRFAGFLKAL
ncbi:MAG: alpha/beta hydrolase [Hyphomicrobiales bacterium]|nr:alpha/beta fold hydrolase [Hyphomicrobiales bacterium]MDE2016703.1 alpha/beta hydrolase [Hyphomicrobiales bacterium]